jgi:dipeptidyl aminopeptidase/acylaminoacyl peptidase
MESAVAPGRKRTRMRRVILAGVVVAAGLAGVVAWRAWSAATVVVRPVEGPLPQGDLIVSVQRGYRWNSPGMPGYRPALGETVRVEPGSGKTRTLLALVARDLRVAPDGRSIAYVDDAEDVWVLRAGRDEPERVRGMRGAPVWTPDGKALIASNPLGPPGSGAKGMETVSVSLDDRERTALPLAPTDQVWDISPDGRRLAVMTIGKGKDWLQVDVVARDGTGRRRLSTGGANFHPRFSPDGRRLAFVHHEGGSTGDHCTLRVVGLDGGDERTIAADLAESARVSWSPDGSTLAVRSRDRAFLVGADGGGSRPIGVTVRREFLLNDPLPRGPRSPLSFGAVEWAKPAR